MKVWRLNVRSQQRKVAKLDQNYLEPYTIISAERVWICKTIKARSHQKSMLITLGFTQKSYQEFLERAIKTTTETSFTPVTSATVTAPVTTSATLQIPSYLGVTKLTVDPSIIKHKCDKLNSSRPVQY
ncbi:hypothetical protein ILYODFUR_026784 [Ilyodon furcidens]|uniref:Uncharacterized protein n=1 Tax=Ilyodon furcidens TaxID=33524 RepID=A0ABV0U8Q1_9TELE